MTPWEMVRSSIEQFVNDPPDSDWQRGYLSGLLAVAKKAFKRELDPIVIQGEHVLKDSMQNVPDAE